MTAAAEVSRQAAGTIIFVCEHGAAKSIVAAAHFNRMAARQNLDLRAIARATHPDERIAPGAADGLRGDGLVPGEARPRRLSEAEAAAAARIVAFCPLPQEFAGLAPVEAWSDIPSVSEDYARARDAMLARLERLLDGLKANP